MNSSIADQTAPAGIPDRDSFPTACIVLDSGQIFYGYGFGKEGLDTAELCFNTAMTGRG